MIGFFRVLGLLVCASFLPLTASAGWKVEWQNTATKQDGGVLTNEVATMYINKNRVRVGQPKTTTMIDYDKDRLTIMNTENNLFWSGKVDEYIREMVQNRQESVRTRFGKTMRGFGMPNVDEKSLPKIVIKPTDEKEKIADRETVKYMVESNGKLFQEVWLAEDVGVSKDLDPKKVLEYEREMSSAKIGQSAADFNALHRSKEYQKLLEKGFVLRSIVHYGSGSFERKALSIQPVEVEESQFEVPESYRRVRLADVFAKPSEGDGDQGR